MILKSQVRTFGFGISVIATIAGILTIFLFNDFGKTPLQGKVFFYFVLVLMIILTSKVLWDNNKVLIDTVSKTITLKNRISQKSASFQFDNFEGYILIDEPIGGYSKSLYLVKNKKLVNKFSSFIYSNYEELKSGLDSLPYLGRLKYSMWRSLKIALNLTVLK